MAQQAATRPRIFMLSLDTPEYFDEVYSNLIDSLASRATIQRSSNPATAIRYLSSTSPTAVLITDPAIVNAKHAQVLEKVKTYTDNGGRTVISGVFNSFVPPMALEAFFAGWNLSWAYEVYQRTTCQLNSDVHDLNSSGLASSYSLKAIFLKHVASHDRVYAPTSSSVVESRVFSATSVDLTPTPVAFASIGRGYLGFVGDVNTEIGSNAVIMAMCGLNE